MPDAKPYDRRAVFAWSLYDFGNSAFATLVLTFVYSTFFSKVIAPDEVTGTSIWSKGIAFSGIVIALCAPLLGSYADRAGLRKRLMLGMTAVSILATFALYLPLQGDVWFAISIFIVANITFELAIVFYNAFLPDIAPPDRIGRISGWAWGLGYAGGVVSTGIAMVLLVNTDTPWFGFTKEAHQHLRATNLLVGVWMVLFCAPAFFALKEIQPRAHLADTRGLFAGFGRTLRDLRSRRQVCRLLVARLIYNDGLITIFSFGGIYASAVFGFTFEEIMIFGIAINISAGIGSWAFGYIDDLIGGRRTVLVTLVGFIATATVATVTTRTDVFWVAAVLIGLFVGPNQSASRSLMGRFVPADRADEFFGFFAFSGKVTTFLGPALLGEITRLSGSHRLGMGVVVIFFLVGLVLMLRVDEAQGIAQANEDPIPV